MGFFSYVYRTLSTSVQVYVHLCIGHFAHERVSLCTRAYVILHVNVILIIIFNTNNDYNKQALWRIVPAESKHLFNENVIDHHNNSK